MVQSENSKIWIINTSIRYTDNLILRWERRCFALLVSSGFGHMQKWVEKYSFKIGTKRIWLKKVHKKGRTLHWVWNHWMYTHFTNWTATLTDWQNNMRKGQMNPHLKLRRAVKHCWRKRMLHKEMKSSLFFERKSFSSELKRTAKLWENGLFLSKHTYTCTHKYHTY